jgi:hypothetical protein
MLLRMETPQKAESEDPKLSPCGSDKKKTRWRNPSRPTHRYRGTASNLTHNRWQMVPRIQEPTEQWFRSLKQTAGPNAWSRRGHASKSLSWNNRRFAGPTYSDSKSAMDQQTPSSITQ